MPSRPSFKTTKAFTASGSTFVARFDATMPACTMPVTAVFLDLLSCSATPQAIATLFDASREVNAKLSAKPSPEVADSAKALFDDLAGDVLGILGGEEAKEDDTALLDGLVELVSRQRQEARLRRDFATSDAIRDRLAELGLVLEDTPGGVRWKRGTPKQRVPG